MRNERKKRMRGCGKAGVRMRRWDISKTKSINGSERDR